MECVLFIPEQMLILYPGFRILFRQKDIMKMDDNALVQTREYLQEFIVNVAANFHHMAGIDEKNIIFV